MPKIELKISSKGRESINILRSQGFLLEDSVVLKVPSLPADLTELGDEDLMLMYSRFVQYFDFLCAQVACAQIDERDLEKKIYMEESKVMLTNPSIKAERIAILRAQIATTPDIIKLTEEHTVLYNYRKLIEMMESNAERDTQLISRELTRRTAGSNHYQSRRGKFNI